MRTWARGVFRVSFVVLGLSVIAQAAQPDSVILLKGRALDELRQPATGDWAEIGQFAYVYRKGAADNPWETRWLEPTDDLLCGLLWEEKPLVSSIEVEFPKGSFTPDQKDLSVDLLPGGRHPRAAHPTQMIDWYAPDKRSLVVP
ncbi:MAG: hypothetical protein ABR915_04395, partial [Thermoguttaceae bacterium]